MALLVRRWRMRRARRWQAFELGPHEYPTDPLISRCHGAAGCRGSAPQTMLIAVWRTWMGKRGGSLGSGVRGEN
eukprot:1420649-Prymnesium_polylepis.1